MGMICDTSKKAYPVPGSLEGCVERTSQIARDGSSIVSHLQNCERCRRAAETHRSSPAEDHVRLFAIALMEWWRSELAVQAVPSAN
jgi:hypothetical protein